MVDLEALAALHGDFAEWIKGHDFDDLGKTRLLWTYPDREVPGRGEHQQAERFRLMKYAGRSEAGVEVEWIWNSRNAVTPFGIMNRDRTIDLQHSGWRADPYLPLHVPNVGDRIFVSLTWERAVEHRKAFVDEHWETEMESIPFSATYESKAGAVEDLLEKCLEVTPEARQMVEETVEWRWERGSFTMAERYESKADAVEQLAKADYEEHPGETPDVVVVDAEMQAYFLKRATVILDAEIEVLVAEPMVLV